MLNHIVLMGRLTRDPELRRTGTVIAVARFSLAVDRDFGPTGNGGEKETDFIDIVAWRSTLRSLSPSTSPRAAWPWSPAGCKSAAGRTRTATSAAALKWWPTMSTLATASGTRQPVGSYGGGHN